MNLVVPGLPWPAAARRPATATRRVRIGPSTLVVAFAVIVTAVLWSGAAAYLSGERARALQESRQSAASYARAVEEHAVRTFESADQTVLFFRHEVGQHGLHLDVGRYLETGIVLGDIFNLVSLTDAKGDVTASSKPFTPINLADREHIRVHLRGDTGGLFISKPVLGRVSGKWSIQMTRRIDDAGGALLGVVVLSMDPFYFTRFYRQIDPDAHTLVSLIGTDGTVRARRVGGDESVDQDVTHGELFRFAMSGPAAGTVDAVSSLDGRRRLYAYRRLAKFPLIAVVGIDEHEALASYDRERTNTLLWAGAGTVFLAGFAIVMCAVIRRLEQSRRAALAASQAKSEFLATMSHELRTPLHGILGYAELLAEEPRDPVEAQYVTAIGRSGRHLLAIVNDILDLGRIEAGQVDLHRAPLSVRGLVDDMEAAHRSSASLKGLDLTVVVEPGVPETIESDEIKLKQVLNNLLHNAVKFTDRGSISLRVARDGSAVGMLVFVVTDTGCGIPPHAQALIFEKFQQADSSLARAHEGTGLGLALVRQMSALLGGAVSVRSTVGAGSTFTVSIPITPTGKTP